MAAEGPLALARQRVPETLTTSGRPTRQRRVRSRRRRARIDFRVEFSGGRRPRRRRQELPPHRTDPGCVLRRASARPRRHNSRRLVPSPGTVASDGPNTPPRLRCRRDSRTRCGQGLSTGCRLGYAVVAVLGCVRASVALPDAQTVRRLSPEDLPGVSNAIV